MIGKFEGEYRWLSNFIYARVRYNEMTYPSAEAAYQAQKTLDEAERRKFRYMSGAEAKSKGGELSGRLLVRKDWHDVNEQIMLEIVRDKFTRNKHLQEKLLATGLEFIEEGNYWHDNYWGNCHCAKCQHIQGLNKLGYIIMQVRKELRDEHESDLTDDV